MIELLKALAYVELLTCVALLIAKTCLRKEVWQELGIPLSLAAVVSPAAAYLLPNLVLLHLILFLMVPLLCWGKAHLIGPVYVFSLMLLPAFEDLLLLGGTPLWLHNIHVTLGIGALFALIAFQPRKAPPSVKDVPFLFLFLLMFFMTARDTSVTNMLREGISGVLHYGVPYYVMSRNVRRPEDIRRLLLALCMVGLILSLIAMFEIARSWPVYRILYGKFGIALDAASTVKLRAGLIRSTGPFIESTMFAFMLTFCFVATILSRAYARSWWRYALMCGILALGLIPPQSRGAWIGAIIGFALARIYLGDLKKLVAAGVLATCIALAALPVVGLNGRTAEILGLTGHAVETADYREKLFERGIEQVRERPFTGTNHIDLVNRLKDLTQGEGIVDFVNHLLYVAMIAGIPGFLIFVGTLIISAVRMWKLRGRRPSPEFALIFVGTVLPLEMLAFTSFGGRPALLVLMFIGAAAALSQMKSQGRAPAVSPVQRARLAG